jgi:hypothetical protein
MNVTYKWVDWRFDAVAWSQAVSVAYEKHGDDIAEMLNVTPSAIKHRIKMDYTGGFTYPNMTNFLACCNLLDLDPTEFFSVLDV